MGAGRIASAGEYLDARCRQTYLQYNPVRFARVVRGRLFFTHEASSRGPKETGLCRGRIGRESDAAIRASRMGSEQLAGLEKWESNFVSVATCRERSIPERLSIADAAAHSAGSALRTSESLPQAHHGSCQRSLARKLRSTLIGFDRASRTVRTTGNRTAGSPVVLGRSVSAKLCQTRSPSPLSVRPNPRGVPSHSPDRRISGYGSPDA